MNCLGQSLPSEESFQWWQILFNAEEGELLGEGRKERDGARARGY